MQKSTGWLPTLLMTIALLISSTIGHGFLKVPLARGGAEADTPSSEVCGGFDEIGPHRATYVAGEIVEFTIDITIPHSGGYHEFRVCNDLERANKLSCFNANRIRKPDGFFRTEDDDVEFDAQYVLPDNLVCEDGCVLQWRWVTPDNGDYHGCADIRILPREDIEEELAVAPGVVDVIDADETQTMIDVTAIEESSLRTEETSSFNAATSTTGVNQGSGAVADPPDEDEAEPMSATNTAASSESEDTAAVVSESENVRQTNIYVSTVGDGTISNGRLPGRQSLLIDNEGRITSQTLMSSFQTTDFVFDYSDATFTNVEEEGDSKMYTVHNSPVLMTGGMAQIKGILPACSAGLPHSHPRATEFMYVVSGTMDVGFVEEDGGRLVKNEVRADQSILIPPGLLHYGQNLDCAPVVYISTFNSEDPGLITLPNQLFQLPTDLVAAAFGRSSEIVNMLRSQLPEGYTVTTAECRLRCNL